MWQVRLEKRLCHTLSRVSRWTEETSACLDQPQGLATQTNLTKESYEILWRTSKKNADTVRLYERVSSLDWTPGEVFLSPWCLLWGWAGEPGGWGEHRAREGVCQGSEAAQGLSRSRPSEGQSRIRSRKFMSETRMSHPKGSHTSQESVLPQLIIKQAGAN